ncbi:RluA family pseudouridine synthase [Candidatus Kaiserbacteria bacterium]|nr:RluA family pseudouridine synthase [Candidatus Kaiserbacteria bacterium]
MNLPILYEDADIVAVNKPAGLITHSDGRTKEETAEDWFKEKYPEAVLPSSGPTGYVHRLDRDTSGVLVFAKHAATHEFLRKAFHDRGVKKTYLAFVYGIPKQKKGIINFDIGRSRRDFRLRSAQPKAKGRLRSAVTRFEVVGESGGFALLLVNPETGRTHQIRVHLKAIHHPIVGDRLYAPGLSKGGAIGNKPQSRGTPNRPPAGGINRLGLHAYALDLPLPSGAHIRIEAPLPSDLAPALNRFPEAIKKFAPS